MSNPPFLKWAGGKRWLAGAVLRLLNYEPSGRFIEPFAGSAACFFASQAQRAILADANAELINAFAVLRDCPRRIVRALAAMVIAPDDYATIRARVPVSSVARAARFVYLNKTAFNGLYRVNRSGTFNVPFVCKPGTRLCDEATLFACSNRLQQTQLLSADFAGALLMARRGDVAYIDPPYTVPDATGFRRYNEQVFSWTDQIRLAHQASQIAQRIPMVISNALHEAVIHLYSPKVFRAYALTRASNIAAASQHRRPCAELLLVSHSAGHTARECRRILNSSLKGDITPIRLKGPEP